MLRVFWVTRDLASCHHEAASCRCQAPLNHYIKYVADGTLYGCWGLESVWEVFRREAKGRPKQTHQLSGEDL